jgi:hypothetical protein
MQKMMKIMAEQRLQDQISKMEGQLGEFKQLKHPVYCLDTDLYANMLDKVKACLMSRTCTILVPMEGFLF